MFLLKLCVMLVTCLNIKQNLDHAWFLGPHTLDKLILLVTWLNIKQNVGHTWFLGPHILGKLIFLVTYLNLNRTLVMPGSSNHIPWVN